MRKGSSQTQITQPMIQLTQLCSSFQHNPHTQVATLSQILQSYHRPVLLFEISRPRRPRIERRRKNLFRHLGLEGLGVGEEHLLRLTLSEGEEGGGFRGAPGHVGHRLVGPHASWLPPQEEVRCRRKDLAKFLGVEEVPTMERVKGRSLDSSSSDCYSIPSYSGTSNFTSSSSSRTPSMTSSEDQMSTKM